MKDLTATKVGRALEELTSWLEVLANKRMGLQQPQNAEALIYNAGSMTAEAGEVWDAIKKGWRDHDDPFHHRDAIIEEMGDTLFYWCLEARQLDVPVSEIVRRLLAKLETKK